MFYLIIIFIYRDRFAVYIVQLLNSKEKSVKHYPLIIKILLQKSTFYMKRKIKVCAVIPARSGSKKVKNKNILKINNHPILAYSIAIAKKSKLIDKVIFSSDSKNYINIAKNYLPDILHKRSKKNSSHTATDLDFLKEITQFLIKNFSYKPDLIVLLRGNCPTRSLSELELAIKNFKKKIQYYSSLRSVSKMSETSFKTFFLKNGKLCGAFNKKFNIEKLNLPKEKFSETYSGNGYIDIIKTSSIKNDYLHGNKVMPFINKDICVDIDYHHDIIYANYLMKTYNYFKLKK